MKNSDLISIIVPIYNIDTYVGICIESIIKQTYKNIEIILVDDGSTDRSSEICDLYKKKDSRIIVIHKKNGGLVSARKAGINIANGKYIGYVDGDDWIGPGFISSLYSSIKANDSDICIAGFSRDLFSKTTFITNTISSGVYEGLNLKKIYTKMISYGDFFRHGITTYVWNKLFKKEILYDCQMAVDEMITIGEDACVVYPAILNSKKITIIDSCAYHYRQREDSMLKKLGSFKNEAIKLNYLYKYLMNIFSGYDKAFNLQKQTKEFLLSTYIIRSGGIINSDKYLNFPFSKNIQDKRIVICGAGTFGQQLKNRMDESNYCKIIGWIDQDYWEYRRCCIDVDSLDLISVLDFDYVIIGTIDNYAASKIKERLFDYGIAESKILTIWDSVKLLDQVLELYLQFGAK